MFEKPSARPRLDTFQHVYMLRRERQGPDPENDFLHFLIARLTLSPFYESEAVVSHFDPFSGRF